LYALSEVEEYQKDQLLKTPDYNTAGNIHLAMHFILIKQ